MVLKIQLKWFNLKKILSVRQLAADRRYVSRVFIKILLVLLAYTGINL